MLLYLCVLLNFSKLGSPSGLEDTILWIIKKSIIRETILAVKTTFLMRHQRQGKETAILKNQIDIVSKSALNKIVAPK